MISLITNTAKNEERVRAVILNGSRSNAYVQKDRYQDYDIVYVTDDLQFFIDNKNWIDVFGERIMLEMPIFKDIHPEDYNGYFNYQMLFTDGNRIDLTFISTDKLNGEYFNYDSGQVLLDKDGLLSNIKFDDGSVFFVKQPPQQAFENKCNTFWWCLQNIAKGIKRKQMPYAMSMLNYVRNDLEIMMSWYIGMNNGYNLSTGNFGKHLEKYLEKPFWQEYENTFSIGQYAAIWDAMLSACSLFRTLAVIIAERYTYDYPFDDDRRMTEYLMNLKNIE
jgi:aminoglycoside 6-adenylyltransferase